MKIVISGSEGIVGKQIVKDLSSKYKIIKLDLKLGHNLEDEKFVANFFTKNKNLYGMIVCHGYNPQKQKQEDDPMKLKITSLNKYFSANVISCFNMCRYFIKNNKKGKIITISSLYGINAPKHYIYGNNFKNIGYCLSKASVIMLTKYFATLYGNKININTVILGGVYNNKISKKFIKSYSKYTPKKRLMFKNEATGIFEFLLDKKSSYANGGVFTIDGGWTSW
jgi:NAD(P)-dependent dehydrogenase (short-subunit alcohol dehydrogenase family)